MKKEAVYEYTGLALLFAIIGAGFILAFQTVGAVDKTSKVSVTLSSNPSVSSVVLNQNNAITLTANATTAITVSFSVTDGDGCTDIFSDGNVTTTVYRAGITASSSCTVDNLNCYRVSTSTHNCIAGSSADATATVEIWYFAQATDSSSSFPNEDWDAHVVVRDGNSSTTSSTAANVELNTLLGINVTTSSINYGEVGAGQNTGGTNQLTDVTNAGNASSALKLSGTALLSGSNEIATNSQRYATSSFTFGGDEQILSETLATVSGFLLTSPTSTVNVSSTLYWGIAIPGGSVSGTYMGTDIFTGVFNP